MTGQAEGATDAPTGAEGGDAVLPLGHYQDFLEFLVAHRDRFEVITYADLEWDGDHDHRWSYPREARAWRRRRARTPRRERRAQVLIQHDVDAHPERTLAMLELEADHGVRSNVMVFHRVVDRAPLATRGELVELDYALDGVRLRELEARGFVIGYHCNAYERARFDPERARTLFREDVAALRTRFDVRFFSNHGGVRDPQGRSNREQAWPHAECGLRLVHNPHGPVFSRTYTDGSFKRRTPESLDLTRHVAHWLPGQRYRVLIHPQYFHPRPAFAANAAAGEWYRDAFQRHCPARLPAGAAPARRVRFPDPGQRSLAARARLALTESLRVWVKHHRLAMMSLLSRLAAGGPGAA